MIKGLSEKLKLLRIQRNLSQSEVSKRINVSPSIISAYEAGERTPSLENLIALANLYHASTDYLLGVNHPRDTAILNTSNLNKHQLLALQNLIDTMN